MNRIDTQIQDDKFIRDLNKALSKLSVDDLVSIITSVGIELKIRSSSSRNDDISISRKINNHMKSWDSWGIDDQEVG